jgi:hypothetical protein
MPSFNRRVAGQPLAQLDNPDPYAVPVWRSPVYETPHVVIYAVQLARLIWRLVWFIVRDLPRPRRLVLLGERQAPTPTRSPPILAARPGGRSARDRPARRSA